LKSESVVVLGAGGFIGRRVINALLATDWARPIAAGRHILSADLAPQVERITLDATDLSALTSASASASAVVSCIAGTPDQITASGRALFAAAASVSSRPRVVYLSSMAAYGSMTGSVDETAPLRGDGGAYSHAKAAIDVLAAGHPFAVRLRPGIVYGPGSEWWSDKIGRLLVQGRLGDLGRCGEGICNLVHVDDVAAAVVRAVQLPAAAGNAFNLANPAPPSWNRYFELYAAALGVRSARISAARLFTELRLYGPALKVVEKVLGRHNPWRAYEALRPWLIQLARHEIRLESGKARDFLGVGFRPLADGLNETARCFLRDVCDVASTESS
jgi:nucleoside-diphosphate-sugar epimerase